MLLFEGRLMPSGRSRFWAPTSPRGSWRALPPARFLQIEVNRGLPAPLLVKYFQRAGLDWQIKEAIRRVVRFAAFDLRQSMSGRGPFDLVFCRNVLIYFDMPTRKKILAGLRGTLAPGGYLLLGASETTFNLDAGFERRTIRNMVAYQNAATGG